MNEPEQLTALIDAAREARERALAPFSKFRVGAAVLANDGRVFTGCNIENASYGLTVCAERVAVWKALSEGARHFTRLAVVADTEQLTPPCGACRQIVWEFCGDVPVALANLKGDVQHVRMSELFPRPFDLNILPEGEAVD